MTKIIDQSKFKAFADNNLNVTLNLLLLFDRLENKEGKGENAGNQHFLLFPLYFQNASLFGPLKVGIM